MEAYSCAVAENNLAPAGALLGIEAGIPPDPQLYLNLASPVHQNPLTNLSHHYLP